MTDLARQVLKDALTEFIRARGCDSTSDFLDPEDVAAYVLRRYPQWSPAAQFKKEAEVRERVAEARRQLGALQ